MCQWLPWAMWDRYIILCMEHISTLALAWNIANDIDDMPFGVPPSSRANTNTQENGELIKRRLAVRLFIIMQNVPCTMTILNYIFRNCYTTPRKRMTLCYSCKLIAWQNSINYVNIVIVHTDRSMLRLQFEKIIPIIALLRRIYLFDFFLRTLYIRNAYSKSCLRYNHGPWCTRSMIIIIVIMS